MDRRHGPEPIEWLLYSRFTVMLVLAYIWVPFVALPIFVSLNGLDRSLLEAAGDLGASRWRTFFRVTLPLSLSGVFAAFLFVFIPTIGEFVTPLLVGGTSGYMYGNSIQDLFTRGLDWQTGLDPGAVPPRGRRDPDGGVRTVPPGAGGGRDGPIRPSPRGCAGCWRCSSCLLVLFLYLPIVLLAVFSFNSGDASFPLAGFTLDWYRRFLANPKIAHVTRAQRDRRGDLERDRGGAGGRGLVRLAPTPVRGEVGRLSAAVLAARGPYLVFGISLLVIFTAFDKILTSTTGTYIGLGLHAVVIGHVVVSLPYAVLTIMPLLERLSVGLEEAAKDLGASPWQSFRRVTLPLY